MHKKIFNPKFRVYYLHPKFFLSWLAVLLLIFFALFPVRLRDRIAIFFASISYNFINKPLKIAKINLMLCFPEKSAEEIDKLLHSNIEDFFLTFLGQAELVFRPLSFIKQRVKIHGIEHVLSNQQAQTPMIFLLPHVWGIDYAGLRLQLEHRNMVTMVKEHRNEVFNWLGNRLRGRLGGNIYYRAAGLKSLIFEMKQGNSFIYLPDEDLGRKKSIIKPFLGTEKATIPVVGRLANAAYATIIPLKIGYDRQEHCFNLTCSPAVSLNDVATKEDEALMLNQIIEQAILSYPEQYMWFLRILRTRSDININIYK